jgi:two-component system CheB/CheR fusion protein
MLDNLVEWARVKYASEAFHLLKLRLFNMYKGFESLEKSASLNEIHLQNDIEINISVFAEKNVSFIIQNIVSNAIKHSFIGGKIIVSAAVESER